MAATPGRGSEALGESGKARYSRNRKDRCGEAGRRNELGVGTTIDWRACHAQVYRPSSHRRALADRLRPRSSRRSRLLRFWRRCPVHACHRLERSLGISGRGTILAQARSTARIVLEDGRRARVVLLGLDRAPDEFVGRHRHHYTGQHRHGKIGYLEALPDKGKAARSAIARVDRPLLRRRRA